MPVLNANEKTLFELLGPGWDLEKFEKICFEFGLELDEIQTNENNEVIYKVDIPSNRHDLLSVEGLSKALLCYNNESDLPKYNFFKNNGPMEIIYVEPETTQIRPYVVGGILRNIEFTEESYKSFIDLQDKLHQNICRRRKLVAIGTHDLDKIQGPFYYTAKAPNEINFVPLKQTQKMSGDELMKFYEGDAYLKPYLPIIKDSPVYPVVYDKNGVVLSLPPIINGEHSKITVNTKNIFIESTCLELQRAESVLNILLTTFSQYCNPKSSFEPVMIKYKDGHSLKGGQTLTYPPTLTTDMKSSLEYAKWFTGINNLDLEMCKQNLKRMMIDCTVNKQDNTFVAHIPLSRPDVLHPCDLAEDIAIAFGYNNIQFEELPATKEIDKNLFYNQIRKCVCLFGYKEVLNWGLCSLRESFEMLNITHTHSKTFESADNYEYTLDVIPVHLNHPKTQEFEVIRSSLIPGLLKSLSYNKSRELPIKLYEVGDIVYQNESHETNATNVAHCSFLYANRENSGFEIVHGMLDTLMERFGFFAEYTLEYNQIKKSNRRPTYKLFPSSLDTFLPSRQCYIKMDDITVGVMGIVHPNVIKNFDINLSTSLVELNLTYLIKHMDETDLYLE